MVEEKKKKSITFPWWLSWIFLALVVIGLVKILAWALGVISYLALLAVAGVVLYILFTIVRAKVRKK